MTWTRLSDDFADRREVDELSHAAFRLHIHALTRANRMLSDGLITERDVRRIWLDSDHAPIVAELIEGGLWVRTDAGYEIDWSDQERAEDVKRRMEANAVRNRRSRLHKQGVHTVCLPSYCSQARRDASRDGSRAPSGDGISLTVTDASPASPFPARGRERGVAAGERSDGATPRSAAGGPVSACNGEHRFDPISGYCVRCPIRDDEVAA